MSQPAKQKPCKGQFSQSTAAAHARFAKSAEDHTSLATLGLLYAIVERIFQWD